jgi:hypothetical protein
MALRVGEEATVWLEDISFQGDGEAGRPITVEDASLHLTGVRFDDCASGASGGAILLRTRPPRLEGSVARAGRRQLSLSQVEVEETIFRLQAMGLSRFRALGESPV